MTETHIETVFDSICQHFELFTPEKLGKDFWHISSYYHHNIQDSFTLNILNKETLLCDVERTFHINEQVTPIEWYIRRNLFGDYYCYIEAAVGEVVPSLKPGVLFTAKTCMAMFRYNANLTDLPYPYDIELYWDKQRCELSE